MVSEPNEGRRKEAAALGAQVINPAVDDVVEAVRSETDGLGADAVIVAIGVPAVATQALPLARKGGRVNLFAGFSAGDLPPMDVNLIHYNELILTGASALTRRHYKKALDLITSGMLDLSEVVTHRFALEDFIQAMEFAESGAGLKVTVGA
jgi:L-iditol 2-dehydrogenase